MSQSRLRAEILDADGSQYAHLYEKLVLGAVVSAIDMVDVVDTRDQRFSMYIRRLRAAINQFLTPFEKNPAALHTFASGQELDQEFERKYKEKYPSKFIAPRSVSNAEFAAECEALLSIGLRQTVSEIYKRCPDFFERIVVIANEEMFREVSALQETFDELWVISGSGRLTATLDEKLSLKHLTHSFFHDLITITNEFAKRLPNKKVSTCFVTLPDALEKSKTSMWRIGRNFIAGLNGKKLRYKVYDEEMGQDFVKPCMLHLIMNHVLFASMHAAYTFCLRDDRLSLINGLKELYEKHPELIASNACLQLTQYANQTISTHTILGCGDYDPKYIENTVTMLHMANELEMTQRGGLASLFSASTSPQMHRYIDADKFKAHLATQRLADSLDAEVAAINGAKTSPRMN